MTVHGSADPDSYPLQKKQHSFEFLRTIAHLRPRTNTFGAIARVRNCVCRSIHEFFQEEGFLYVHTPIITASDCEGAGEMFRVTTLDLEQRPHAIEATAAGRFHARTSSTGRRTSPSAGSWRRRRSPARWARSTPSAPPSAPRTPTPPPPGRVLDGRAGDGLLRPARQHGPGRAVPQADLRRRAGTVPRKTWSSSTSASTTR